MMLPTCLRVASSWLLLLLLPACCPPWEGPPWEDCDDDRPGGVAPSAVVPSSGANLTEFPADVRATLPFDIDAQALQSSWLVVRYGASSSVAGDLSVIGPQLIFTPTEAWPAGQLVEATVAASVRGVAGQTLGNDFRWSFTMPSLSVPVVGPATILQTAPATLGDLSACSGLTADAVLTLQPANGGHQALFWKDGVGWSAPSFGPAGSSSGAAQLVDSVDGVIRPPLYHPGPTLGAAQLAPLPAVVGAVLLPMPDGTIRAWFSAYSAPVLQLPATAASAVWNVQTRTWTPTAATVSGGWSGSFLVNDTLSAQLLSWGFPGGNLSRLQTSVIQIDGASQAGPVLGDYVLLNSIVAQAPSGGRGLVAIVHDEAQGTVVDVRDHVVGSGWAAAQRVGALPAPVTSPQLQANVAAGGQAVIAVQFSGALGGLFVAARNGGTWSTKLIQNSLTSPVPGAAFISDVSIHASGDAIVLYRDTLNGYRLVARRSNQPWSEPLPLLGTSLQPTNSIAQNGGFRDSAVIALGGGRFLVACGTTLLTSFDYHLQAAVVTLP